MLRKIRTIIVAALWSILFAWAVLFFLVFLFVVR